MKMSHAQGKMDMLKGKVQSGYNVGDKDFESGYDGPVSLHYENVSFGKRDDKNE